MNDPSGFPVPRLLQRAAPRVLLVAMLAWWWPSLIGGGDPAPDVALAGDAQLVADSNPMLRQLRERGLSVVTVPAWNTWCDVAGIVPGEPLPDRVVLSFRTVGECGGDPLAVVTRAIESIAAEGRRVVVIRSPFGPSDPGVDQALDAADAQRHADIAEPERLLGPPGTERLGCMWWDDCEPDGTVAVRNADGSLTWAGMQRVARLTAGIVP